MTRPLPFEPSTPLELRNCLRELREAAWDQLSPPLTERLNWLAELGQLWQPDGPYFQRATELLKGTFSDYAVRQALTALVTSLNRGILQAEVTRELGRLDLLDRWETDEFQAGCVKGYPLGVVAQVLAGNVFLNGIVGLAQGLLTKNAVLLKLSRRDAGLTSLFVESLRELAGAEALQRTMAVCRWDSRAEEFNQALREEADAIVVWGGAEAIAAYPADQCAGRVIHHGPRLGIGVVRAGQPVEPNLAWDIALWEQQACSSPRVIFVETEADPWPRLREVGGQLSAALSQVRATIPPQPLSLDQQAEALSIRELADWSAGSEVLAPRDSLDHTLILQLAPPANVPLGYRTLVLTPFRNLTELARLLHPYRAFLQTAVLSAPATKWASTVDTLVRAGISQVTAPGSAASRFLGLPHEGDWQLRRLVRMVGIDLGAGPLTAPQPNALSSAAIAQGLES